MQEPPQKYLRRFSLFILLIFAIAAVASLAYQIPRFFKGKPTPAPTSSATPHPLGGIVSAKGVPEFSMISGEIVDKKTDRLLVKNYVGVLPQYKVEVFTIFIRPSTVILRQMPNENIVETPPPPEEIAFEDIKIGSSATIQFDSLIPSATREVHAKQIIVVQ